MLRMLHILCKTGESRDKALACLEGSKAIVEQWEQQNDECVSIFLIVNVQDQELFDRLQDISASEDAIRLAVSPVEAYFPRSPEEEAEEEKQNSPRFFDIISREEMEQQMETESRINGSFLGLLILSTIVATIAIEKGNVTLLIGAMVLAPMLGPNLALAFSLAIASPNMGKRALLTGSAAIMVTLLLSAGAGAVLSLTPEPSVATLILDYGYESILVAACAGTAATILLLQGTAAGLIGVMVAVAFLPPLVMTGLSLSSGDTADTLDAALLFAINLAAFNLAVNLVLLAAGVRPRRNDDGVFGSGLLWSIAGWGLVILLLTAGLWSRHNGLPSF